MIFFIIAIVIIFALIYLTRKRYIEFILLTILCLLWLIPSELAGWQEKWWVTWIISPLILGTCWYLSHTISAFINLSMVQRKCTDAIIDNLFYDVTPHYRNIQLEKIVGKAIKHNQVLYSEEHNAAECCAITAEKVSENQKPIYYAATAYSILYCNHNISEAIYWCKKSLELLECYHRDYIILDAYKWFYNEPLISRLLFDDNGYSNIPNNPLKIPNNYL